MLRQFILRRGACGSDKCSIPFHVTSGAGTAYPSGAPEFTPGFQWGSCYSIFSFICMIYRSLFVLLYFFFWPLCCLFFFDIRILITPLVSANSSYTKNNLKQLQMSNSLLIRSGRWWPVTRQTFSTSIHNLLFFLWHSRHLFIGRHLATQFIVCYLVLW